MATNLVSTLIEVKSLNMRVWLTEANDEFGYFWSEGYYLCVEQRVGAGLCIVLGVL